MYVIAMVFILKAERFFWWREVRGERRGKRGEEERDERRTTWRRTELAVGILSIAMLNYFFWPESM